MTEEKLVQIQRQLRDQSDAFNVKQGADLVLSVLDTCNVLLDNIQPEIESASENDLEDFYYAYLPITRHLTWASRKLAECILPAEEDLSMFTEEAFSKVKKDAETKKATLEKLKASIKEEKALLATLSEQYDEQIKKKDDLERKLEDVSHDKIQKMVSENTSRNQVIKNNKDQIRKLTEEEQKLKAELEEQQHQIDLIPIEIQDLRKEYKEKETEIQELNNAKILYSPARIKQQEQEVKRLQGEIERLTTRSNSLTEKTEKLKAERIELADVFPKLESRALEYAKSVLVSLEPGISDKLEEVEQIREDAERLSDNLQQCNKLRSQYQGWLRGVETPLERLMSAMDEPESKVLKETLDPTKCNSIHTQITNARLAVESLDHVLKELMEAYGEDVARIYREAMAHES